MKTDVVKPQGIFFNPSRLVVPLFQRPYVWSRETQWEPLWQDIVRLIEVIEKHDPQATHFLGAIVTQQMPIGLGGLPTANVIDGQQRLTTLQLLLDALHAELERRGLDTLASQVHHLIENPPDACEADEDRYKLWPTNRDRDAFAAVMSAPVPVAYESVSPSRLRDAHQFFAEAVAEWLGDDAEQAVRRARVLVPAIKDRLEIASITLDANEDAQAIFETLNARGTPLSAADLIKNFVFQQMPAASAERSYFANWAEFETPWWETEITTGRITNPRASLFLWQWLVARTLVDFPIREVFTQFKYYVTTVEKDVTVLLPRIRAAADRYRAIIEGSERSDGQLSRIELFGYRVGTLGSEIARPLLIWLDEPEQSGISDADRRRILEVLESWFVRRALVKAPTQGTNRFLIDLLRHLSTRPKEDVADSLEAYLVATHTTVGYWPGDNEVRDALTGAPAYWKYLRSRLRMVLEALEDDKRGYPDGKKFAMGPIVRGKATIEHLMPQGWRTHWSGGFNEADDAARDQLVQQLGNLTLITQSLNSSVSNGAWTTKRDYFLRHNDTLITMDAVVAAGDGEWDKRAIEERTDHMIGEILEIWPAPAGHVGLVTRQEKPTSRATVDLAQLVSSGWLRAGAKLTPTSSAYRDAGVAIAQDGRVFVGDVPYDYPSGAGRAVAGTGVNGWTFWTVAETGKSLADLRDDYLESLGEDDAADLQDNAGAVA